jgi:hypothetical protein
MVSWLVSWLHHSPGGQMIYEKCSDRWEVAFSLSEPIWEPWKPTIHWDSESEKLEMAIDVQRSEFVDLDEQTDTAGI